MNPDLGNPQILETLLDSMLGTTRPEPDPFNGREQKIDHKKIKEIIKALGLKMTRVAEKAGLTVSALSSWNRGLANPTKQSIFAVEDVLLSNGWKP